MQDKGSGRSVCLAQRYGTNTVFPGTSDAFRPIEVMVWVSGLVCSVACETGVVAVSVCLAQRYGAKLGVAAGVSGSYTLIMKCVPQR